MVPPCLLVLFCRGRVSPLRRRVSFWTAKKKPKSRQGAVQMGASRPYSRSPGPPFYEGPNQAALAVDAKARVVQSNACPSSFAAAYLAVNRELGTPLFECAFVAVGLKFSSGTWRAATWGRPYGVFPHVFRAARPGGRALQPNTNYRLFNQARRGCGTAPAAIFAAPGPSGPVGI